MSCPLTPRIALALLRQVDYTAVAAPGLTASQVMDLPPAVLTNLGKFSSETDAREARDEALRKAEGEARFIEAHGLRLVTPLDADYPERLRGSRSEPRMLTILGNARLSPEKAVAMVGTRRCSPYGVAACNLIVKELSELTDATIISGLAYGIDAAAHQAALEAGLPTIAVVAHGLGMIYPSSHRDLAKRIVNEGGAIVSEYLHEARPFKGNFLTRNGIIAALADATLVMESDLRGGAMGTAAHALGCGRKLFALPGHITDSVSSGCNNLISCGKARILTSASEVCNALGWEPKSLKKVSTPSLFPTLEGNAALIANAMRQEGRPLTIDEITRATGLPVHQVMSEVSELEFSGVLTRYPGGRLLINQ